MTEQQTIDMFRNSVRLQRLSDENELLLLALREIVKVGARSKIRTPSGRHYYAMCAERAFKMAERVIDCLEGREVDFTCAQLSAQLAQVLTFHYPEGGAA